MRTHVIAAVLLAIATSAAAQNAATIDAAKCAQLKSLQVPGVAVTITGAEWVAAGPLPGRAAGPAAGPAVALPAYCRIDGVFDRRQGVGGQYAVGFAVALPASWNGRFLMQGGGGLNGRVGQPLGNQATGGTPALARGFAVASTDTGHQATGGGFDAAFMQDQQAALDFAFEAIGRAAAVAKDVVTRSYGAPPNRSYFVGCSTGGREAMLMAQRFPTYFDGIVSGDPAMRTGHSNLALRSAVVALKQAEPLSDANRKAVIDGIVNACDGNDGVKDGMIFDRKSCRFDPTTLVCTGAKTDGCLSPAQASAVARAMAGPKDAKGNQVYPGFPFDTGIAATGGGIPGILLAAGPPVGGPTASSQDIDAEARAADRNPQAIVADTWSWTNLNTFTGHGGKLLFYHGLSDPWFSPLDTVDYYERLGATNGGADAVRTWSRLFLSPGMAHCAGGPGALDSFDLLGAVVAWVEKGVAPDAVTATGRAFPGRSRPLCAYPQHAQYKGSGDTEDARNFVCRD